jgi:hypothetical protein
MMVASLPQVAMSSVMVTATRQRVLYDKDVDVKVQEHSILEELAGLPSRATMPYFICIMIGRSRVTMEGAFAGIFR